MTFTQLEIFALVAELRGFTAAAMRLGVSQSAISHAIKSLEQELGVQLIERQGATADVTELGQRLLVRAREILGLAESMRQEVSAASGLNKGLLRIGSFGPTSSLKLIPAILDVFQKRYPGIEVRIDEGTDDDTLQWILDRRVDIGFIQQPDDRFDTVDLVEDQMVALLPAGHHLAARKSVSAHDLANEPFIMPDAGCSSLIEPLFSAQGLCPQVRYRMSQVLTVLGMVGRGDGVSGMAELALPVDLASSHPNIAVRPFSPPVRRRVGLALRNLAQASPAAKAFVEVARKVRL
ncbi:LysR family transcriptional regulator [Duganella sp. Root1480D1]|uniref:LysR family transcriptional regulator n=1 Tax=Duganella sp. Root1480D1 TaxID=1736471 RepID=UPI00071031FD|nr:LysR family transcriptional regulator [Duganella sp. Root1480D1]KQZ26184.1 LysR family transcriptional regulator [Duganella sp. Root1480D1]